MWSALYVRGLLCFPEFSAHVCIMCAMQVGVRCNNGVTLRFNDRLTADQGEIHFKRGARYFSPAVICPAYAIAFHSIQNYASSDKLSRNEQQYRQVRAIILHTWWWHSSIDFHRAIKLRINCRTINVGMARWRNRYILLLTALCVKSDGI